MEAKNKGIKILKRGELLAKLCQGKKTIAVAGSHGKTTTTSLLGYLLVSLGYKPTVFLGGLPLNYSRGAWLGGDYFVIETDESDGSFLYCNPWVSAITNIDHEHLDFYGNMESLRRSFLKFACQTKDRVFGWGDSPCLSKIISQVDGWTFGWGKQNLIRGDNLRFDGVFSYFDLYIKGEFVTVVRSPLLGKHNCLNVLAAFAFFYYLGEDLEKVNRELKNFKGTERRFQIREKFGGVTFVDDYAHHPVEIEAVLSAARFLNPKRIFVIFQPHRFSRVKLLQSKFSQCFFEADEVVISDVYSAGEKQIEGISGEQLCRGVEGHGKMRYLPREMLSREIPFCLESGDLVLALGAGDINILMEKVIDEFKKARIRT